MDFLADIRVSGIHLEYRSVWILLLISVCLDFLANIWSVWI